jgi:hypothetical protein
MAASTPRSAPVTVSKPFTQFLNRKEINHAIPTPGCIARPRA